MAESIKMPFQVVNLWGLRNSVLDGGPYPPQERGTSWGHFGARPAVDILKVPH